ncbi:MAG: transporter, partial [Pseudomonas sp.]
MDTLPYAPLFGTLALALLWSALYTAVDAARLQLNGSLRNGDDGQPPLPAQALVLCAS